ncbi:hypothetical protein [Geminicoccus flavidas]|uniref:hypothetical protein n=1 Tax=Geminicoccus flavidas TaxID=2506407 RepID=UPI0013598D53|nr:hypothetical protein [Geminicoccus flavidas]
MARVSQALQFKTTRQSSSHAKAEADPDVALIEAVAAALQKNDERSDCLREIIRHLIPPLHDKLRRERGGGSGSRH